MVSPPFSYRTGQRLIVRVEKILPFGIFVRLADGSQAYVRRRELTLEGDQDPRQVVTSGQSIEAVIQMLPAQGRTMELSVKDALPDPWDNFSRKYKALDKVHCSVKHIYPSRVQVCILPGVDGWIPVQEFSPGEVDQPGEFLWVGDHLEAVITQINTTARKVYLSIRRRQEQVSTAHKFMTHLLETEPEDRTDEEAQNARGQPESKHVLIGLPNPVMLIEDKPEVRMPLEAWLKNNGCEVQSFECPAAVIAAAGNDAYSVAVVDLDMSKEDFTSLLRFIGERLFTLPLVVLGDPDSIYQHAEALEGAQAAIVMKPIETDDIKQLLVQISQGEMTRSDLEGREKSDSSLQTFQNLGQLMRSNMDLNSRLNQALQNIVQTTCAELGVIFFLDPISMRISILAQVGELQVRNENSHLLIASPVKDSITEEKLLWEEYVSKGRLEQYQNLRQWLDFESCIGVPIQAGGQTEHALFVFHRKAKAFSLQHVHDAMAVGFLSASALEAQILQEKVQSLSRILLSGNLAAALGHEINNQMSSLDLYLTNLRAEVTRLGTEQGVVMSSETSQSISHTLDNAIGVTGNIRQTVDGFRRLMDPAGSQPFEVNQVIRQAIGQIMPLIRDPRVSVQTKLGEGMPSLYGGKTGLYQVVLNLMINAIQKMREQAGNRLLVIESLCVSKDAADRIQIRITDTGPGIHHNLWEKIFALGFTTRKGGSGLGLFIARSLIESMHGKVYVEESLIPLGTTFLVEIPTPSIRSDL